MLTGIHRHYLNIFVFWKSKSKITKLTCVSPSTEMRNAYAINMASESWRNQRSILPTCQCVCVAGARSGEGLRGSGPRGQSPPVTPAPKWTRLCRPWSSALLWGGRIFQERQKPLNPNEITCRWSKVRGEAGIPNSAYSPLRVWNWSHVICPLHSSWHMPFFKSAGGPTPHNIFPVHKDPSLCVYGCVYVSNIVLYSKIYIYIYMFFIPVSGTELLSDRNDKAVSGYS